MGHQCSEQVPHYSCLLAHRQPRSPFLCIDYSLACNHPASNPDDNTSPSWWRRSHPSPLCATAPPQAPSPAHQFCFYHRSHTQREKQPHTPPPPETLLDRRRPGRSGRPPRSPALPPSLPDLGTLHRVVERRRVQRGLISALLFGKTHDDDGRGGGGGNRSGPERSDPDQNGANQSKGSKGSKGGRKRAGKTGNVVRESAGKSTTKVGERSRVRGAANIPERQSALHVGWLMVGGWWMVDGGRGGLSRPRVLIQKVVVGGFLPRVRKSCLELKPIYARLVDPPPHTPGCRRTRAGRPSWSGALPTPACCRSGNGPRSSPGSRRRTWRWGGSAGPRGLGSC